MREPGVEADMGIFTGGQAKAGVCLDVGEARIGYVYVLEFGGEVDVHIVCSTYAICLSSLGGLRVFGPLLLGCWHCGK